jgi:hypothetical protein
MASCIRYLKRNIHSLSDSLTQRLIYVLKYSALLDADVHVTSLTKMPDDIIDQVVLILFGQTIPLQ